MTNTHIFPAVRTHVKFDGEGGFYAISMRPDGRTLAEATGTTVEQARTRAERGAARQVWLEWLSDQPRDVRDRYVELREDHDIIGALEIVRREQGADE